LVSGYSGRSIGFDGQYINFDSLDNEGYIDSDSLGGGINFDSLDNEGYIDSDSLSGGINFDSLDNEGYIDSDSLGGGINFGGDIIFDSFGGGINSDSFDGGINFNSFGGYSGGGIGLNHLPRVTPEFICHAGLRLDIFRKCKVENLTTTQASDNH
jgi:hypothetical protein